MENIQGTKRIEFKDSANGMSIDIYYSESMDRTKLVEYLKQIAETMSIKTKYSDVARITSMSAKPVI